jgi:hypothetical protein
LVEINRVHPEAVTADEHLVAYVVGSRVIEPLAVAVAEQPSLRGDNRVVGIDCFTQQAFADAWPVGVCGVNEVDW